MWAFPGELSSEEPTCKAGDEGEPDHGQDPDQRVHQRMPEEHRPPGDPLGLRHAHVIRVQNLQHGGAGHTDDQTHLDKTERDARQQHIADVRLPAEVGDRLVSRGGEPA